MSLKANTRILDMVRNLKSCDGIFSLFNDMLSREFTKITIISRNIVKVVALEALIKLCFATCANLKISSMNIDVIFTSYLEAHKKL